MHKLDKFAGYRGVHRFKEFRRKYLNNVDDLGELSFRKHKRQDVEWPKIRHGNVGKLSRWRFEVILGWLRHVWAAGSESKEMQGAVAKALS